MIVQRRLLWRFPAILLTLADTSANALSHGNSMNPGNHVSKWEFVNELVSQMTIPEMVLQLHLMFGDNIVGPKSENELYDFAMRSAPDAAVGNVHDWYPLNTSRYNELQRLNSAKARLDIPFMHFGECLHGVGSFKQSMFPQSIGMAASFDRRMVHRVGRAIGSEARSIGVHACLSPVLDLGKDPRWGRAQEAWGEDKILTSLLGVAYASGLSRNGSWNEPDAVAPVMKHFAAHGAPQSGHNGGPWMGRGNREVLGELLIPFKAVVDLGGVRGVMMSYNELDDVPSHVNPMLYDALSDWNYDGFVMADDTGMRQIQNGHGVSTTDADTIEQWFNAGGMIQFYDYPLETYLNATIDLVGNNTVPLETLRSHVRRVMGVKYDLGLFQDRYISNDIDPQAIVASHVPLTLEAAHRSIVLLENRNNTLPLKPRNGTLGKIALIGPYGDILNYGDYSGQFGAYPTANSSTILQAMSTYLGKHNSSGQLKSSWGANTWLYNAQYPIAGHHLYHNGTRGGLSATYFANVNFTEPLVHTIETPVMDWGLYPPPGLPSNNFSVIWEGELNVPVDVVVNGWLGVALNANTTAKLYVDDELHIDIPSTTTGNILSNIPGYAYTSVNSTLPPPGSAPFLFTPGKIHRIRIEYQALNLYQKIENQSSLNAQVLLFWNLVDSTSKTSAVDQAVTIAREADTIVLAVGANWNSDGESGDRATLSLSANQTDLADAIFALGKPVVLVLQGGRPFAIPQYYAKAAAVLNTYFPGQSGGQAIADVLFGEYNPGGRIPLSVPVDAAQIPVFYNYKPTARKIAYTDITSLPSYSFGYGLSYTSFDVGNFTARAVSSTNITKAQNDSFTSGDTIIFNADVRNNGTMPGSYVTQVYLLQRVSQITQPVKQLVAFDRIDVGVGETARVEMTLEVNRFLTILDRKYSWLLETGDYTFALMEHGGIDAAGWGNVSMTCC